MRERDNKTLEIETFQFTVLSLRSFEGSKNSSMIVFLIPAINSLDMCQDTAYDMVAHANNADFLCKKC